MKRIASSLMLAGLLSACVPPSATSPGRNRAAPQQARIEPDIETVFDEKPVWEARPVVASSEPIGPGVYVVQPGDNLFKIGERTGAGLDVIARSNGLTPPYALRVGQQLNIPAGQYHRVQAGESGIAIARAYGVMWTDIIALNGLTDPFVLKIGQRLALPQSAGPLPSQTAPANPSNRSIEARAAAFKLDIDDILTGGEPASEVAAIPLPPIAQPSRPMSPNVRVSEPGQFSGQFGWPVRGRVISRFGPGTEGEVNDGIDISVGQNAPIYAAGDGVVAFVGSDVAAIGGLILVRHGDGWISAYGRASQSTVTRGQSVKRGQVIGHAGTGATPLFHFQLRKARKPVDPIKYLPANG
jgi:murein DD-endopeptidase MepM/ murein hydrolase activator NlpD